MKRIAATAASAVIGFMAAGNPAGAAGRFPAAAGATTGRSLITRVQDIPPAITYEGCVFEPNTPNRTVVVVNPQQYPLERGDVFFYGYMPYGQPVIVSGRSGGVSTDSPIPPYEARAMARNAWAACMQARGGPG